VGTCRHRSGGNDRPSYRPSQVYTASGSDVVQVVNDTARYKARHIINDSSRDEDGTNLGLAEIHVLGCARDDSEGGTQTRRTQSGADDEGFNSAISEAELQQKATEPDWTQHTCGSSADRQGKVGL
jgi:hypothetical protein